MTEVERLRRRYEREKKAREEAEQILEAKSRELFERNNELKNFSESLEKLVEGRTEELLKARDAALAATRAKSLFIANMSHEIRTPLNGVLGMLNILANAQLSEREQRTLKIAQQSGRHLLGIVNDILDFSKIDAGEMTLHLEAVNLVDLVQQTLEPMRFQAEEKNTELVAEYASDFPDFIHIDSIRTRQIITNLVSNAIKFTNVGKVTFSLDWKDGMLIMSVCDTGIGMTQTQLKRIFDAFGQADDSITRQFGGTGLGLTITARLTTLMGGTIHVESTKDMGSEFIVCLPLRTAKQAIPIIDSDINEDTRFKAQTVLLVEDNDINIHVAKNVLEQANLQCDICRNGVEAIAAIKAESYALVFMDVQMPVMDGLTATRTIRRLGYSKEKLPIIAMTAHATMDHYQESMNAGMNGHVIKPLEVSSLIQEIAKYLPVDRSPVYQPEQSKTQKRIYKYIDVADALSRVGGNARLLARICNTFYTVNKNSADALRSLTSNKQWHEAAVLVHTIKGSAANISAMLMYESASRLEETIHQQHYDECPELIEQLMTAWSLTAPEAKEIAESARPKPASRVPVSVTLFLKKIRLIHSLLKSDISTAETEIEKLSDQGVPESVQQPFSEFKNAIDIFDIKLAEYLAHQMIKEIDYGG